MQDALLSRADDQQSFTLSGPGPWRIGRAADAEIGIPDDPACSRLQASIRRDGEGFRIMPHSRTTSIALDGRLIDEEADLRHGTMVAFAAQRLQFSQAGAVTMLGTPEPAFTEIAGRTTRAPDAAPAGYIALDRGLTVGRQPMPGQHVFDHPAISRRHAAFEVRPTGIVLRDLGSTNGTFLNGVRVVGVCPLGKGDRIDIGPFQLLFDGAGLHSSTRSGNAELAAVGISKDIAKAGPGGGPLRLLNGVTLTIRPRSLVCIVGASGSGKSTLMNILAGRNRASEGAVALNGQDLHANFAALKQDVAFVPQQDVLHEQLTLRQALDYAAQLRLPPDTTAAQRKETVQTAAQSVDLAERLDTRIAALSGGQKKRASLAAEILSRPSLLFLDEVTSGLDESTDWEIMKLLRRLADEGMTIVAVTHTLANVEAFCHEIVCMGRGGHMTFAGPPAGALTFFGVARLGEVFNRMEDGGPQRWRATFEGLHSKAGHDVRSDATLSGIIATPATVRQIAEPRAAKVARMVRQFRILTHRNCRLLLNDRRTLTMAAVQSVLIGGLMGYAFEAFGAGWQKVNAENALLLLLGFLAIWLGCNATSKDIVGDLVIYRRERDINLSTVAFVASKYVVSGIFAMLQLIVASFLVSLFAQALPGGFLPQLLPLLVGCAAGAAIGLVISAFSDTRDQATTIVPLALVPQLILAGVLVPKLPEPGQVFAKLAVSGYWLTEAMKSVFITVSGPVLIPHAKTGVPTAMTAHALPLDLLLLVVQGALLLTAAYTATNIRHSRRG